ncbi:Fe-S cluster assembly sulfur transfer protein SufU [Chloroflexus aggregans]|uniref:SUF system FeS assembly protein, NifU family n=1 Tax=Chloroflexus aggregans (strain MD-66 / DSM 9485) TaxID=326427 RepID=B8G6D8_CHLAD|nr:SUF system NifU family Fe-S cluster assembly protein [Chloroflexus aggregans]ACL23875.1 SUF system FeS assembly protein, NifU family [Chloroflexus aggregans DSM 9485]
MDDIYREQILEHARHPRNYGHLPAPTVIREERNPLCGDQIRLELAIVDDVIADVRFTGRGCAISQASASLLTEAIKGKPVAEAKQFSKDDLLEIIGIPLAHNPTRLKCALLSLKALKAGLYGVGQEDEDI